MTTLDRLPTLPAPPAVVLGLGQNGLATVRALGRKGVPVIGVDSRLEQPTARSRYCLAVGCDDVRTEEGLLPTLLAIGRALRHPGVLFPSGDLNLLVISENQEALAPYFRFALPSKDTIRLVLDKKAFYDWAAREGFRVPRTWTVGPDGPGALAREISYPAILKPYLRDARWRARHDVKLYQVSSPEDLMRRWTALARDHADLLLQECIPGGDSQLVFSLTYLDRCRQPVAMFTGRKLRQFPPRFGTSSLAESRWDPEVAAHSLAVLEALHYRGYGSVEFKRDPRDGRLYMIEVTARTWYPHGLATRCGVNLPYLAYCELLGLPADRPQRFVDGMRWIDEDRDPRSALQYHREGELGLREWLASYAGPRTYAIAARDDPGPLLHLAARTGRGALRALGHKTRFSSPAVPGLEAGPHGALLAEHGRRLEAALERLKTVEQRAQAALSRNHDLVQGVLTGRLALGDGLP